MRAGLHLAAACAWLVATGASAAPAPVTAPAGQDWSGLWGLDMATVFGPGGANPVLTPEYAAKYKVLEDAAIAGHPMIGPETHCVPPGMPLIMAQPYPIEFLFAPGKIVIIQEAFSQVRDIYTDGRGHPDDPDPTFDGNSIGHWEGDTLVVDTIHLRDDTYLQMNGKAEAYLAPHSGELHIVERIRQATPDRIEDQLTITDPKALAQPLTLHWAWTRHADWTRREYVCVENNREASAPNGVAQVTDGK